MLVLVLALGVPALGVPAAVLTAELSLAGKLLLLLAASAASYAPDMRLLKRMRVCMHACKHARQSWVSWGEGP